MASTQARFRHLHRTAWTADTAFFKNYSGISTFLQFGKVFVAVSEFQLIENMHLGS